MHSRDCVLYSSHWSLSHRGPQAHSGWDREMVFAGVLEPGWIPQVVADTVFSPKSVVYEVFGPVGTVADISYFDVNSDPHRVDRARLPWFLQITANVPAVMGNVVAQGDSNSIGCRIVVNGQVKAERISNEVNAYTHCLVKCA